QGLRIVDLRRREIETRHRARRNRFRGQIYAAFLASRSAVHSPLLASEFIRARWVKARWPAETFSALPAHAFCGAACSARPYEKVSRHGRPPIRFMALRCAVAS